jgi:outer membrane lipoprotein SlyB
MDSTTSSSLALDPSATPGAAAAAPRRTAWWVAGGLGVVGAGALAAALTSAPKPAPVEPVAPVAATAAAKGKANHAKPAPATTTTAAADICATCGTVESVKTETRKGEGTGIGAVAGGVLGGVVGQHHRLPGAPAHGRRHDPHRHAADRSGGRRALRGRGQHLEGDPAAEGLIVGA